MADGSYIHLPESRAALRAKLADIERREKDVAAEAKPIRDEYDAKLLPFVERESALEEERELLLQQHGTEIIDKCVGCGVLILEGDRHLTYEEGEVACLECSPTWEESAADLRSYACDHPEDEARRLDGIAHAEAMVAAGRGKEKVC